MTPPPGGEPGEGPGGGSGGRPDGQQGPAEPPVPRASRRSRAWSALSVVVLVVVVVAGGWYLWSVRDEVCAALAEIGIAAVLACLALTSVGVLATGACWRVWLAALADAPPARTSHQVFYLTQSGKYLPGSLWPFLAQALLARRFGVPRSAMLTATSLFLITHVVTGVAVGVLGAGPVVAAGWRWLLYPTAAAGLVLLLPPVLLRVVGLLDRVRASRGGTVHATPRDLGWSTVGRAVVLMLAAWGTYGGATWVLVRRLEPDPSGLPLAVGAYALAWVVGFLAVAAPAGVGAREATMVVVLAPLVGASAALAVALVSRVTLTVVDLGLAAASAPVLRAGPGPGVVPGRASGPPG